MSAYPNATCAMNAVAAEVRRRNPTSVPASASLSKVPLSFGKQRSVAVRTVPPHPCPLPPGRGIDVVRVRAAKRGRDFERWLTFSLALPRRRGEGRGEGLWASALAAPPLIRPGATCPPPPRKGEGVRPAAPVEFQNLGGRFL